MNRSESKYFNTARKMNMALISLLKKKKFEYITVSELCKAAEVNRSTFYLHYENLYELNGETARFLLDRFLSYFSDGDEKVNIDFLHCDESKLIFVCEEYLMPYLEFFRENREVLLTALSNIDSFGFDRVYEKMFDNVFDPILERFHYPAEDRKYVMAYYLNGINAVITEWLRNECKCPTEKIAKIIEGCVFGLKK